jgi:predicted RNA-binding Zn ribbon-like protein
LAARPWQFDLCGGHLALDFANAVSARHTDAPIDRLPDYGELLSFGRQTKLLAPAAARKLGAWADAHPEVAAAVVARARGLRDALYEVFAAVADGRRAHAAAVATLNERMRGLELGDDLEWRWAAGANAPDAFLLPVLRAAVELLASGRERVKICQADDCIWLFFDTSKNGSRRWCDMKQCGNRMKARRWHDRHRHG